MLVFVSFDVISGATCTVKTRRVSAADSVCVCSTVKLYAMLMLIYCTATF